MSATSESDPPLSNVVDTREFFFPGSHISTLLIHGLTGTPYEMRHLGQRLADAGIRTLGVRLAGHARSPEELGATTHNSWYQSVVDGYERLREYGDPIVVVGQSAGGVLATRLAIDQRDAVSGLVMLAPAFYLPLWQRAALRGLARCGQVADKIYLHGAAADVHDGAARQIHPSARLMPLGAALSLCELSALVRPRVNRVVQPTLLLHSRNDHTCPFKKNVDFVMNNFGAVNKRLVALSESYHVISVDTEKDRVALEVIDFVRRLMPRTGHELAVG
jgi:carboxylesterase